MLSVRAFAAEPTMGFAVPQGITTGMMVESDDTKLGRPLAQIAVDIDPDGLPAVADGNALRLFGSPRELVKLDTRIDDFAWMRDGRLLLVTGSRLAALSPKGIGPGLALPAAGMRVRPAGDDTAYVYGGPAPLNRDIYLVRQDGKVAKLATLPASISAVAGDGNTTYVAAEKAILRIAVDQSPRLVVQTRDPVISLDSAPNDGLFYATASGVGYVDRFGRASEFIRGDGGLLRVRGDNLFVLMATGSLLRLGPIDKFEASLPPIDREIGSKPDDEAVTDAALVAEIQDRLYELNFDPGRRDGGIDNDTAAVIREYEAMSSRTETGKATYGLLRALRATGARGPWGAIVYAKDLGKYGMGWGHASRKAAVGSAVASCGDPARCTTELTFFGSDCGAFAHSGTDWSLAARDTQTQARQAALDDCQKRGATCRIVAAVCADGSNRSEAGQ